jgi:rare lipoprotein A
VCNLNNGRCTVVVVTDRGPVLKHRIIDLSRAAAARLDFIHAGLARVRITEESR